MNFRAAWTALAGEAPRVRVREASGDSSLAASRAASLGDLVRLRADLEERDVALVLLPILVEASVEDWARKLRAAQLRTVAVGVPQSWLIENDPHLSPMGHLELARRVSGSLPPFRALYVEP